MVSDVDDAIERAEARPTMRNPSDYARDCRILAAEVKRLRRFIPPDDWVSFGTHANCGGTWLEFSEEVGEDGLPLWERPITHLDNDDDNLRAWKEEQERDRG